MSIKKLNENVKLEEENMDIVIDELLQRNEMEESSHADCTSHTDGTGCGLNNAGEK